MLNKEGCDKKQLIYFVTLLRHMLQEMKKIVKLLQQFIPSQDLNAVSSEFKSDGPTSVTSR
jgi:hypothetical protein